MDKLTKINIKKRTIFILCAIFLAIFTLYGFLLTSFNSKLILVTSLILTLIYYFICFKLYHHYTKFLEFLCKKDALGQEKISKIVSDAWILPSFVLIIFLILFLISIYYLSIISNTAGWTEIDYGSRIRSINNSYRWIGLIALSLGMLLQIYLLRKNNLQLIKAIIYSIIAVFLFGCIILVIMGMFMTLISVI
ncbi:hypothetical protein J4232_01610 [Candidatus Woesearchaeota archaeon]|nr:hypothetical protein [Candidatus Woesearchaeota archaeon]